MLMSIGNLSYAQKWPQITHTVPEVTSEHRFGESVDIDGDYAIVGTYAINSGTGFAYLMYYDNGNWVKQAKLTTSSAKVGDWFGYSVSISGDVVIIGAPADNEQGTRAGAAYIFQKPLTGWTDMTETAKLMVSGGVSDDRFGRAVSIDGDVAVIGAPGHNDMRGTLYVFQKPQNGWVHMTQTAQLTNTGGNATGLVFTGTSVSISGNTIVCGAPNYSFLENGEYQSRGVAYVYQKPGENWVNMNETARITASDGAHSDKFGSAIDVSGDVVVVGAHSADLQGEDSGAAYIFEKPATGWVNMTESAKILPTTIRTQN